MGIRIKKIPKRQSSIRGSTAAQGHQRLISRINQGGLECLRAPLSSMDDTSLLWGYIDFELKYFIWHGIANALCLLAKCPTAEAEFNFAYLRKTSNHGFRQEYLRKHPDKVTEKNSYSTPEIWCKNYAIFVLIFYTWGTVFHAIHHNCWRVHRKKSPK